MKLRLLAACIGATAILLLLACTSDDTATDGGDEDESASLVDATTTASPAEASATDAPTESPIPVEYEIASREDVSFATTTRIVFRVSVSGPLTEPSLRAIADEIIAEETASQDVNAIGFFFYLPGTDTNGAYTAGVADWAPNGDWAEADSVQAGDYSQHELGAIVVITP